MNAHLRRFLNNPRRPSRKYIWKIYKHQTNESQLEKEGNALLDEARVNFQQDGATFHHDNLVLQRIGNELPNR